MQTFAELVGGRDARRARLVRGGSHCREARHGDNPRGSGLRTDQPLARHDARAVVPTQAKTLTRLRTRRWNSRVGGRTARLGSFLPIKPTTRGLSQRAPNRRTATELDRWIAAVGPENEEYFWQHLKAQGDSTVDLIHRLGTAVSTGAEAAVNAAVSRRAKRGRGRKDGSGRPLTGLSTSTPRPPEPPPRFTSPQAWRANIQHVCLLDRC